MMLSKKRIGNFTGSEGHKLVPGIRGGQSQRNTYIFEKAQEKVLGFVKSFRDYNTDHGHFNEFEGIQEFSKMSGLIVEPLNNEYFEINENCGATPDAKVVDFSGNIIASVDIKCPTSTFFIQKMQMINESETKYQNSPKQYYYQAQMQMMALKVDTHYLVRYLTASETDFDGNKIEYNLPIESRIYWKVIKSDKKVQDELLEMIEQAANERDLLVEIFKKPILS
jgi:YqaJ-like recombinase protein